MDLGISGRVAVVTGGSEGIGKAAAHILAEEGVNVVILARTQSSWMLLLLRSKRLQLARSRRLAVMLVMLSRFRMRSGSFSIAGARLTSS